jgi:hypothetical protein
MIIILIGVVFVIPKKKVTRDVLGPLGHSLESLLVVCGRVGKISGG